MMRALRSFEVELQRRIHLDGYHDVSVAHTNVLRHLNPEGMRLIELATDAGMTKQAVSQAVRALQERDLVAIEPDPEDGRAKRVAYTRRGRELIECGIRHIAELEEQWSMELGERRYRALRKALLQLGELPRSWS